MRYLGASISGLVAAPIEQVWAVVSDPLRHPELAGSGQVQSVEIVGGGPMAPGAVFQSKQLVNGLSYVTANRAVIWNPPYQFAWRGGFFFAPGVAQIWMFSLSQEAGGTRVENSMAQIYALPTVFPFKLLHDEIGRREVAMMAPTLANLAKILGAPAPSDIITRYEAPEAIQKLLPWPTMQGAAWEGGVGTAVGILDWGLKKVGVSLPR